MAATPPRSVSPEGASATGDGAEWTAGSEPSDPRTSGLDAAARAFGVEGRRFEAVREYPAPLGDEKLKAHSVLQGGDGADHLPEGLQIERRWATTGG